jgi:hypothetical protein
MMVVDLVFVELGERFYIDAVPRAVQGLDVHSSVVAPPETWLGGTQGSDLQVLMGGSPQVPPEAAVKPQA